jgi:hypothetical protein
MKGKKCDLLFVNKFIEDCVLNNILNSEDIVKEACSQIEAIDIKIREVENLKKLRSKLSDVINTLNKTDSKKESGPDDIRLLSLFKIPNPNIGATICKKIKVSPIEINNLKNINYDFSDTSFIVKQLLENKVLSKRGSYLLRGDMFDIYCKYVIQEHE